MSALLLSLVLLGVLTCAVALARRAHKQSEALTSANAALEQEVSERRRVETETRRRAEFELVVGRLATSLVNVDVQKIDAGIERAIEEAGRFTGAERASLALFVDGVAYANVVAEWCGPQIDSRRAYLENLGDRLPADRLEWFADRLRRGKTVYLDDLDELAGSMPDETYRPLVEGVRSVLAVPVARAGTLVGWIGLTASRPEP